MTHDQLRRTHVIGSNVVRRVIGVGVSVHKNEMDTCVASPIQFATMMRAPEIPKNCSGDFRVGGDGSKETLFGLPHGLPPVAVGTPNHESMVVLMREDALNPRQQLGRGVRGRVGPKPDGNIRAILTADQLGKARDHRSATGLYFQNPLGRELLQSLTNRRSADAKLRRKVAFRGHGSANRKTTRVDGLP